jgi:hypothetical protein
MKLDTASLRKTQVPDVGDEDVVDEFDGPQLVTIRERSGKRFLGVLIDTDDDGSLWLLGRLNEHNWRALIEGRATLRGIVHAPGSIIVARDWSNHITAAWVAPLPTKESEDGGLGEKFLPEKGALLPKAIRDRLVELLEPPIETPPFDDRSVEEGSTNFVRAPVPEQERAA